MIGTSFGEWILIRVSIILCRYTPFLYFAALLVLLLIHGSALWDLLATKILIALSVAEAIFYGFIYRPYELRLEQAAVHPAPLSREERRKLLDRCLANVPSPELYLKWWFLGADPDDIRRDNLTEFLLWAFFDRGQDADMAAGDQEPLEAELEEYIDAVEKALGRKFADGRGPAKCLRLTLESIHSTYRSLPWYIIVFMVDQLTHLAMLWHGFEYYAQTRNTKVFPPRPQQELARRRSPAPELSYWYRPHESEDELPVVFFHGIGIGLWVYTRFLAEINSLRGQRQPNVGIIAIEILPISFRLTAPPLDKRVFLEQFASIIEQHDWDRFAVASHSYGSVLTTHVLSSPALQHRVKSVVLIDPVTIMLHLPDVAYNFTRRRPKRANEWQLWYFASTDPGVAHCLGRHFFWQQNIIWREDLLFTQGFGPTAQRRAAVSLSGRDLIVDVARVTDYLATEGSDNSDSAIGGRGSDIEVLTFPKLDHAQIFDQPSDRRRLVALIRSYCEK